MHVFITFELYQKLVILICIIQYAINITILKAVTVFMYTRGEGGLWPPSPLVWVAGATLISSEEVVSSELINLFECNVYIKNISS